MRFLARLGDQGDVHVFADRLRHGFGRERRHAFDGLRRTGSQQVIDGLLPAAVASADLPTLRRVLYQAPPSVGRWKRLELGLQDVVSGDRAVSEAGRDVLHRTLGVLVQGRRRWWW